MSVNDVVGFKVSCSQLERSVAFYQVLGFEPAGDVITSNQPWLGVLYGVPGGGVRMQAMTRVGNPKGLRLELLEWSPRAEGKAQVNSPGAGLMLLKSSDLAADCAALTQAGGELVSEPATLENPGGRTLLANLRDPDGFALQLVQFIRATS